MKNKVKSTLKKTLSWVIGLALICVLLLFAFWNIRSARLTGADNANLFTAIGGWVGFLATAGIGIISIWQARHYNEASNEATKKMSDFVASIDESIWRSNIPIVELEFGKNFFRYERQELWEIVPSAEKESIQLFANNPKAIGEKPFPKNNQDPCTARIVFSIKNLSNFPIQSIECESIQIHRDGIKTDYNGSPRLLQGYIKGGQQQKCQLFLIDKWNENFNSPKTLQVIIRLKLTDARGYSQRKIFHIAAGLEEEHEHFPSYNPHIIGSSVEKI